MRHLVCLLCAASAAHFAFDAAAAVPVEESVAEDRSIQTEPTPPPQRQNQSLQRENQSLQRENQSLQRGNQSFQQKQSAALSYEDEQPVDDNRRLSELFYQLQVIQQEVLELRGIVEEQSYQLNRMARDQKEQYIDLDRRVAALRANSPAPAVSASVPDSGALLVPTTTTSAGGPATERDAYTSAFNLMRERQFEQSAMAFNQLIVDYPNGQFTPNAFYWLGELYLTNTETEKARQSFVQVVNLYPDHQKVPDALYKLGVVYHRLGDTRQSLQYLRRVRNEHPQSSAAGLAETYAAELQ